MANFSLLYSVSVVLFCLQYSPLISYIDGIPIVRRQLFNVLH